MKENAIVNIKKLQIPQERNKKSQTHGDWNTAIHNANEEANRDKENELPDDGSYTQSQIDEVDDVIKKAMDEYLSEHRHELQGYINRKQHQQFITRWSQLMENSVLDSAEIFDKLERKSYQGHGQVDIKTKKIPTQGCLTNIPTRWKLKPETKTWKD